MAAVRLAARLGADKELASAMAPPPPQVPPSASASASSHGVHMNGGEGDASYAKNSTPQVRRQRTNSLAPVCVEI
jgi:hypothetical protein